MFPLENDTTFYKKRKEYVRICKDVFRQGAPFS